MARTKTPAAMVKLRQQVFAVAYAINCRTGFAPQTIHITPEQMRGWQEAGWSTLLPNGTRLEVFDEHAGVCS